MDRSIHILLIGPRSNPEANLIGGATVSFGYLKDYLDTHNESYTLVNTKRFFGIGRFFNPLYILWKVLVHLPSSDVVFLNSSRGGTKYLAPLLYALARLFGCKFVFRPFGGNINTYTAQYGAWQKYLFEKTILQSDLFFLQTKALMQHYQHAEAKMLQLPTCREAPEEGLLRGKHPFQKRFIYLGGIRRTKGINHLLAASKALGEEYTLHLYGPIIEEAYHEKFAQIPDLYQGILRKEELLHKLREYDVLMLPTFYDGEGYPGVLIEAYSLGLPVITTEWKAIPEIVRPVQTGYLIEPDSTSALVEAIQAINTNNYPDLSNQARAYFLECFASEKVTGQAISQIKTLFSSKESAIKVN